ncbi:ABC transporter substrate-binding protein [Diaphorobacter ruginosibacter]|uniref:ABC transporter substrate-binding protein n=1 Tax=Diaphorobacter ruginosibacter TaxID=1715720 RepID=UPI003340EAFC
MSPWKRLGAFFAATATTAVLAANVAAQGQPPILIGQTVGVTGSAAATVKESMLGASLYFQQVNAQGGIGGRKIELVTLDDKFDPKLTFENARTLIEKNEVTALFMPRGTPHTKDLIPLLDKHGVPLVGPSTGAMALHQPVPKNIFHIRAPYQREVEMAIEHMLRQGSTRIGILHVDDAFGEDGLEGAQKAFKAHNMQAAFIEKFDRAKPDFSAIAPRIFEKRPQTVIVIGTGQAVVDAILALRATGLAAQLITLSNNASSGFTKALGDKARGVIVTQVFPSERSFSYPLIQELAHAAKTQGAGTVSPAVVEGFANAKVLVEGLRRAAPTIDRQHLRAALDGMSKYDLGGLEISYSSTDHSGLDYADLSIITADGRFQR